MSIITEADAIDGKGFCCNPGFVVRGNQCDRSVCPCEGCCDFNCCDELDYFMHVAFQEAYATDASGVGQHFGSYEEFFNAWY